MHVILVYNDWYMKIKLKTYGVKVYINVHGLNVPEDVKNKNLLQIFPLILFLCMGTNITFKQLCL